MEDDEKEEVSKPITLGEHRRRFLNEQFSKKIPLKSLEVVNKQTIVSKPISLDEHRNRFLNEQFSKKIPLKPLDVVNKQTPISKPITLDEHKNRFLRAQVSKRVKTIPARIEIFQNINYTDLGSKKLSKIPSVTESYLSNEKRDELYKEYLLYLIELRDNRIELADFLKSIWKDSDIRKCTISELFRRISVKENKYNRLQLRVMLFTFIYAIFSTPDFNKLNEAIARRFNMDYYIVSKMVEETVNGFYDIVGIDLDNFILEDLEKLEIYDILDDSEKEEDYFYEEKVIEEEIFEQPSYFEGELEEFKDVDTDVIITNEQSKVYVINNMETSNINIPNFREKVMEEIKKITGLIKCTDEQKKIILSKSKEILEMHILRVKKGEITITKATRPLTNAAAIIYAVLVSNRDMPEISGREMGDLIGVSKDVIPRLYRDLYKDLAKRLDFDFQSKSLKRTRKLVSLYFFELLNHIYLDLNKLISYLEEFDISSIIVRLGEIIINWNEPNKQLTSDEYKFLKHLTEEEIGALQNMAVNYSDTFTNYFTDLFNIIKLLIISNKSHIIIGADFFCQPFVEFLIKEKDINLSMTEDVLHREVSEIFDYLKDSKYSNLFPARRKKIVSGETYWSQRPSPEQRYIVGSRIKIFIMIYIHKGKYFKNGLAVCLDCFREGLIRNISYPRLRAKSFHHETDIFKIDVYSSETLYKLFNKNRGNPYFLFELLNQMEGEGVVMKCRCHHRLIHSPTFTDFKKLISWEHIPHEFFYKDIFDLPAEIIHILVVVCVDNFYKTKDKT